MTDGQPVASVVIPTKNRWELLGVALSSVLKQTVEVEVLVLDDGSTESLESTIHSEFPRVRYLRTEMSHGPTWQRNRGVGAASSPIIVTLDDDCQLVSTETIAQVLAEFDDPRVAGVTIPYVNVRQDTIVRSRAPACGGIHATLTFMGGMVAFRRDVYLAVGGYRPEYFMHVEESDLALRLLAAGYVVRLGTADPLHHHESPVRDRRRLHVLGARNHVLFSWFNVPQPYLLPHLVGTICKHVAFAARSEHPLFVCKGIAKGLFDLVALRHRREPVDRKVYSLSRRLKREGTLALDQIARFL